MATTKATELGQFGSKLTVHNDNITLDGTVHGQYAGFDSDFTAKSTSDLSEGTNLYYTDARADARADVRIAAATTADLTEGSNLYYTTARSDSDTGVYISGNRTYGNITTTGYIAGPATMTIDPAAVGDNTGTLVIAGNLQVDGTTTTINSTTMEVDDLNLTLASGAANAAAANGAGITVDGASATITYDGTNDEWDFNKNVNVTGNTNTEADSIVKAISNNGTVDTSLTFGGLAGSANLKFYTNVTTERLRITSGGDISFYEDTGTTAKFFWDASTESVQLGGTLNLQAQGSNVSTIGNNFVLDSGYKYLTSGAANMLYFDAAGNTMFFKASSGTAGNAVSFSETMRISSAGNVGIGTTSPSATLDVVSNSASGYVAEFRESNASNFGTIVIDSPSDGSSRPSYMDYATGGTVKWSTGLAYNDTARAFHIGTGSGLSNSKVTIKPDGNVGIGTTSPSFGAGGYGLEVKGSGRPTIRLTEDTNTHAVQLSATNGAAILESRSSGMDLVFGTSGVEKLRIDDSSGYLVSQHQTQVRLVLGSVGNSNNNTSNWIRGNASYLQYNSASSGHTWEIGGAEKMRIHDDGNVGIGTSSPNTLLDVNGSSGGNGAPHNSGISVRAGFVAFRNDGTHFHEVIQGESNCMGIYNYNYNDGVLIYTNNADSNATPSFHPAYHFGGYNNADQETFGAGWANGDPIFTMARPSTKYTGTGYGARGVSNSGNFTSIVKTATRTEFRDNQGQHYFHSTVVANGVLTGESDPGFWYRNNAGANAGDNRRAVVLNDGQMIFRAYTDYNHKMWYADGINLGTNQSHGHFRVFGENNTSRGATDQGQTHRFSVDTTSGNVGVSEGGTQIYNNSDERLKTNIVDLPDGALTKVNALRPVTYDWRYKTQNDKPYGFIAQEVQAVDNELVFTNGPTMYREDKTYGEGLEPDGTIEDTLGINERKLLPIYAKAIQELSDLVEQLQARIAALEE